MKNKTKHTPGAVCAAMVITGFDYSDKKRKIKTTYGDKTTEGIADIIEKNTAAP